jgi:hypothetical protein
MNQIEQNVLETIGESVDSPDVFTDDSAGLALIRGSINDAIEEISMLTGAKHGVYHMLLRSGQSFYRMDFRRDRFAWITDAWLVQIKRRLEQTDLTRLNAFNPRWLLNTGSPQSYGQIGNDVFFTWPCPAGTDVVELRCVVIPDRYIEDYDRVKLRETFQWAAVHYAVGEYYASRGDAKQALYHHNIYVEKLGIQTMYPATYEKPWRYKTEKTQQAVTG